MVLGSGQLRGQLCLGSGGKGGSRGESRRPWLFAEHTGGGGDEGGWVQWASWGLQVAWGSCHLSLESLWLCSLPSPPLPLLVFP